ncbi:MAG: hypothetical protein K0Q53_115 [Massilibacillus sp.]|jgi:hypothetical protein|nr:hypothetical protein [Massilibacillus sp.]
MIKQYCTQNNGDCETCSLVNYGLDCRNNPVGQGGAGRGQGRKSTGRSKHNYYVTPEEDLKIKEYIQHLRATAK